MCRGRWERGRNETDEKTQHPFSLTAAFLAAFLWPLVAPAQESELPQYAACEDSLNLTAWVMTLSDAVPNIEIITLDKNVAATVVENHNAAYPPSDYDPERVYFLVADVQSHFILVFTDNDDCVTYAWPVPIEFKSYLLTPTASSMLIQGWPGEREA